MSFYEITYIARAEIAEKDVSKITDELSKQIKDKKGKVVKSEYWGLRDFTYEIKKAKRGHYSHLGAEANAEAIKELDRSLRLNESVLRYLIVKVDEVSKEPSPILGGSNDEGYAKEAVGA